MNTIQKRFLLFLIGCIGVRSLIVYFVKNINIYYLPILGYLALIPSIGFLYIYLTKSRLTGPEVFGGKIWWNNLRPVHSLIYFIFFIMAINKNTYSWILLLLDVIIGLTSFIIYHYYQHNFIKLLG